MLLEGAAGKLSVDQTELCGRIRASAVQQLFLVGEALEISRRDAQGRIPLRNEELSVEALVADLAREIAFGRSERGVRTVWQVPAETPWIESDAVKLRMILRNLIENALQFTRAGEVCARVEVVAEKLVLEVRDTGIGIPPEERERIFEAFRQVGGTRSGGLGLGLYIVRRLAQAMNGTVEVQSRVGEGSVFTVRLPVRVAEAQPKPLAAPAPPAESVARRAVAGV
jgi:signal transduction histidine kinase